MRLRLGLTQKQLAKEIGVAEYTIWRWEKGKLPISKIVALGLRAHLREFEAKR